MNTHAIQTDGLIFDLDGTLWDASEACTVAWNLALTEAGVSSRVLTADNIRSPIQASRSTSFLKSI